MEHALVFASIIVGVAVSDQIVSLNRLLVDRRRVRWDWAAPALALLVLLTNIQVWWALANDRADGAISIGAFLPTLIELVLLALLSAASLPGERAGEIVDLRAYYEEQARYLWALYALALGWVVVIGFAGVAQRAGFVAAIDQRAGDLLPLAIMIALVFVRSRWFLLLGLAVLSLGPIGWLSRTLT